MRSADLGETGLRASVLGFGCAPIGGRVSARTALRALAMAHARGVNYFDTARSYGYGESERILGQFLRGKRDRVVVSTKCGIHAGRTSLAKRLAKTIARPVLDAVPSLRRSLRKTLGAQHAPGRFDIEDIRQSVHESLRELGTDYIDLLLLHMPGAEVLARDDIFKLLESFVAAGKLRAFGVSAGHEVVTTYLQSAQARGLAVQYPHNWLVGYPDSAIEKRPDVAAIGNQPFAGVAAIDQLRVRLARMTAALAPADGLRAKLQVLDAAAIADLALGIALRATHTQVSVCSMYQRAHIEANVAAIEASRFSDDDLARLRAALLRPA